MTFVIDNPRGVATTPLRKICLGKTLRRTRVNHLYFMQLSMNFADIFEHKSKTLLHFAQQTGIARFFLLFEQHGVNILITLFWDTQYNSVFLQQKERRTFCKIVFRHSGVHGIMTILPKIHAPFKT